MSTDGPMVIAYRQAGCDHVSGGWTEAGHTRDAARQRGREDSDARTSASMTGSPRRRRSSRRARGWPHRASGGSPNSAPWRRTRRWKPHGWTTATPTAGGGTTCRSGSTATRACSAGGPAAWKLSQEAGDHERKNRRPGGVRGVLSPSSRTRAGGRGSRSKPRSTARARLGSRSSRRRERRHKRTRTR